MSKHTPGPWYVIGEDEVVDDVPVLEVGYGKIPSPEHKLVAHLQPTLGADNRFSLTEVDHANAHLIAAAPNLLADLIHCVQYVQVAVMDSEGSQKATAEKSLERIQATIAQAQGLP